MPDNIVASQDPSLRDTSPREGASGGIALRWFELSLVLLVAISSPLYASIRTLVTGSEVAKSRLSSDWSFLLLQEIISLLLLGYVLWRRKMTFRDLGLSWSSSDPSVGILLAVGGYVSYTVGYSFVHFARFALFHAAAQTESTASQVFGHPAFMSIPLVLLNPLFEELIVRAYLMKEIRQLTGSWLLAGTVSVTFQTAYHLYQGWERALSIGFMFLAFSVYYAKAQKATPIVVAHGIMDAWALSRLW